MKYSEAKQHIQNAFVAGMISGIITLIVTLISFTGVKVLNLDAWNLIDVVLVFGLTYGIYKNSRICAVTMLIYFISSKIYIIAITHKAPNFLAFMFIYYFFQGARGTFAYHTLLQNNMTEES